MSNRRKKAEAAIVPANRAEAEAMLQDYVAIERDQLAARLLAEIEIDAIKARRDGRIAELEEERSSIFAGIKAWWEATGAREVAGNRRSAELANAMIGIRKTPPAVKLARKVKAADVLSWLASLRWSRAKEFRRVKVDLDRQAIIKAVQADPQIRATFLKVGVSVEQVDEFFIDAGLDEEAVRKEIAAA